MGIFDHQSDRNVSPLDAMWFDELDHGGGSGGGGGDGCFGLSCGTLIAIALGIVIGIIAVVCIIY